jgi:branched-chain amino acid transport system substrate-binding protein
VRLLLSGLAVVGLGAALTGCGGIGGASTGSKVLTVYSSLPLQGPARARSLGIVNGEKLALSEAGGRAGHFRVAYVSLDDTDPSTGSWGPGQASSNARTAAQDNSAIAYLGDWDSGATAVSLPIVNGAGILQVSPASSYAGLTNTQFAGKGEPDRYYPLGRRTFGRIMPADTVQAAAQLDDMHRLGVTSVYLIRDRDVFDADLATIVATLAPARQIQVVDNVNMSPNPGDDGALALRAAGSGAAAVLYAGAPSSRAAALLRQVAIANPALKILCPYFVAQADFLAALGPGRRMLNVTSPTLTPTLYSVAARRFAAAYRAAFGTDPGPYALYGYEAMKLVLDLIHRAGRHGNDRRAVVNRFFRVRGRDSVLGRYSITPSGDTTLSLYAVSRVRRAHLVFQQLLNASPLVIPSSGSGAPAPH